VCVCVLKGILCCQSWGA